MSVDQIISALSAELVIVNKLEADDQVCGGLAWLLVTAAFEEQLLGCKHAGSNKHIDLLLLLLHCVAVQSDHLTFVSD